MVRTRGKSISSGSSNEACTVTCRPLHPQGTRRAVWKAYPCWWLLSDSVVAVTGTSFLVGWTTRLFGNLHHRHIFANLGHTFTFTFTFVVALREVVAKTIALNPYAWSTTMILICLPSRDVASFISREMQKPMVNIILDDVKYRNAILATTMIVLMEFWNGRQSQYVSLTVRCNFEASRRPEHL